MVSVDEHSPSQTRHGPSFPLEEPKIPSDASSLRVKGNIVELPGIVLRVIVEVDSRTYRRLRAGPSVPSRFQTKYNAVISHFLK